MAWLDLTSAFIEYGFEIYKVHITEDVEDVDVDGFNVIASRKVLPCSTPLCFL